MAARKKAPTKRRPAVKKKAAAKKKAPTKRKPAAKRKAPAKARKAAARRSTSSRAPSVSSGSGIVYTDLRRDLAIRRLLR